jgi:hypothetical protein
MILPPDITSLTLEAARAKVQELTTRNEELKAELERYRTAPDISANLKQDLYNFQAEFLHIARHTATLLSAILSIWLVHWTIDHLLGTKKFFNWIQISYFFDPAHIAMLLRFFVRLIKDFGTSKSK